MSNGTKTGQHGTAAQKSQQPQARTSAARNLLGFVPYLARYRPAIALGLLALVLTSIVGNIIRLATGVMKSVRMVLGPGIMYTGQALVTMIIASAVMARLSPSLTLWVLLPVPVVFVAVRHFGKVIHDLYEMIQASLATLSAKVQENLSGVRVIRAYAQEEAEIRGFDEPNREYVARNIKLIRTWSMFMPSLQSLIGFSFLIVLWQGGHQLLRGQISLGALIAFYSFLGLLVWPMIALGWVTNIFQRGAASMGRLNYILRAQP